MSTMNDFLGSLPNVSSLNGEENIVGQPDNTAAETEDIDSELEDEEQSDAVVDEEIQEEKKAEERIPSWTETHNLTEEEYTKQKEELETLRNQDTPFKSLLEDDFVKGYAEHIANGGKAIDYIQKQAKVLAMDFDTMPQIDAVRQAHILKSVEDGFTEEEAMEEWEDWKADNLDVYDEDSPEYSRKVKRAFINAKPTLDSYKKKLAEPLKPANQPEPLTQEQIEAQEKANREFVAKYNKEQPIDFKFKVGGKEISLKDKGNLYKNFEKELETQDLMLDFRREDKSVDEDKFLRAMYVAKNFDKLLALAHKQGATENEANRLESARNPKGKDTNSVAMDSIKQQNLAAFTAAISKRNT